MTIDKTIGFVGAGAMGEALIKGLCESARVVEARRVIASDPRAAQTEALARRYGIRTTADNREVARESDVVVLAVKPQTMADALAGIAGHLREGALVISIAAGVPIAAIEAKLGRGARVVRVMPNTPALVGAGATGLAAGTSATEDDVALARRIFDAVGMTVVLEETALDAVTGLSGSGPAYVFLIIEALSDAGVKVGLARQDAQALAAQTVLGAAKLLIDTGEHPGRLKDMVCSPGGTAIAGLHTLEAGGLRTTLMNAVEAATRRSRELGDAFLKKP
ncbi:MAG: pyrroline-5-carboxylate reductase [Myxococcota bacterium]